MGSQRNELLSLIEQHRGVQDNMTDAVKMSGILPQPTAWACFINSLLLWVGCITLGLSFIFFLAHNWSHMSRLVKFALVESALVLAILAYLRVQIYSVSSSAALMLGAILLGALMAFFGQTYQTGADPWQLFFYWAMLITPWALISRFVAIWLMWLVLLNLSIGLYCDVNGNPLSSIVEGRVSVVWLIFGFNTFSFVVWVGLSQKLQWLQKQWAIRLLATVAGITITSLALGYILESSGPSVLALAAWAVFLSSLYYVYRVRQIDLFMLAGSCLSVIVVIVTFIGKEVLEHGDEFAFLLLSGLVIGLGTGAAFWLKQVQQEAQL
ncbi:MAG: DUF2157 domain-containing protein [Gammaproteobacteria bacterium]|nr:DUF2157 domain-containing protein [Gammaproteobacteria bacterium]